MADAKLLLRTADGSRVKIDSSTTTGLLIGTVSIGGAGSPQSGSIYNDALSLGRPFFTILRGGVPDRYMPSIYFSGNSLVWTYPSGDGSQGYMRPSVTMLYGIY